MLNPESAELVAERVAELRNLGLLEAGLDAAVTSSFDELAQLTALACEAPMAALSFLDGNTQWIRGSVGLDDAPWPLSQSFCAHAIQHPLQQLVVPDALADTRFAGFPQVGEALRFYAGAPVLNAGGLALGVLCVLDTHPRELNLAQAQALGMLARQAGALLELRRKERLLDEQRGFFRSIVDALHEGLLIRDGQGRLSLANGHACELLGEPLAEHLGERPRSDAPQMLQLLGGLLPVDQWPDEHTLQTGKPANRQLYRAHRRDGSELTLEINTRPLLRDGRVDGVVMALRDVMERMDMEQQLRLSESRLASITDNVPALIAYVDRQERITFCNRALMQWLGQEAEMVLGHSMADAYGEAYAPRASYVHAALAGKRQEFGLWSDRRGEQRYVQTTYVPDLDESCRVRGFIVLGHDLSEMKTLEMQLAAEARFDPLTGLPNRKEFNLHLAQAVARARRRGAPLVVGFLDVDEFKQINDSRGHAVGDLLLKEMAGRLRGAIRQTDFVSRLAGDEFTLVLEDVRDEAELRVVAEKLLATLRVPYANIQGGALRVTASMGLALGSAGETAEALLARADAAMYEAKADGRDRYVMAGPDQAF